jgi:hypothetical protein
MPGLSIAFQAPRQYTSGASNGSVLLDAAHASVGEEMKRLAEERSTGAVTSQPMCILHGEKRRVWSITSDVI